MTKTVNPLRWLPVWTSAWTLVSSSFSVWGFSFFQRCSYARKRLVTDHPEFLVSKILPSHLTNLMDGKGGIAGLCDDHIRVCPHARPRWQSAPVCSHYFQQFSELRCSPPTSTPLPWRFAQLLPADANSSGCCPRNAVPPLCSEVLGSRFLPRRSEILFGLGCKSRRVKSSPALRTGRRGGGGHREYGFLPEISGAAAPLEMGTNILICLPLGR